MKQEAKTHFDIEYGLVVTSLTYTKREQHQTFFYIYCFHLENV